jgi:hypothetical protein
MRSGTLSAALMCWLAAECLQSRAVVDAPPEGALGPGTTMRLVDLANRPVNPFDAVTPARAFLLVFVSTDCPISNRYAPEIRRLSDTAIARGVRFWLVYPNASDSPDRIRRHIDEYAYPYTVLRDPDHRLVKRAGITVTPEATVYDASGKLTYRGRIDDRYVRLDVVRPSATSHDLHTALMATLAGTPVVNRFTQAVGCFVADSTP